MEKRRETRQLRKQDVIELALSIKAELAADADVSADGQTAELRIKAVPCGANCGSNCGCHYSLFESLTAPAAVTLKATQRVSFIGNLAELLAERKAMETRIAMIEASYGNGKAEAVRKRADDVAAAEDEG